MKSPLAAKEIIVSELSRASVSKAILLHNLSYENVNL